MKQRLVLPISTQLYSCYHGYDKPQRKTTCARYFNLFSLNSHIVTPHVRNETAEKCNKLHLFH